MSIDEVVVFESLYNGSTINASDEELLTADADETSWTKKEFGDLRLIFAVLPPPIIVVGVLVNVVLLGLTAARREGLRQHPVGVYVVVVMSPAINFRLVVTLPRLSSTSGWHLQREDIRLVSTS